MGSKASRKNKVKLVNPLIGRWVHVCFWDHAKDSEDLVYSRVSGMIKDIDNQKLVLTNWSCEREDLEVRKLNDENYSIALATIDQWGIAEVMNWKKGSPI